MEVEHLRWAGYSLPPYLPIDLRFESPVRQSHYGLGGLLVVSNTFAVEKKLLYQVPDAGPVDRCREARWLLLVEVLPEEAERLVLAASLARIIPQQHRDPRSSPSLQTLITGERTRALGIKRGRMIQVIKGGSGEALPQPAALAPVPKPPPPPPPLLTPLEKAKRTIRTSPGRRWPSHPHY